MNRKLVRAAQKQARKNVAALKRVPPLYTSLPEPHALPEAEKK